MSLDTLKDDIKKNNIRNLYLFYGPEEYLKKYYTDSMEKLILSDEMKSLNYVKLEGKVEASKIIEACETMPVFSDSKIVIVKNSGMFKGKKGSEGSKAKAKSGNDELISYLQDMPDYTCLIFYEEEIDKRIKMVDLIKKKGLIVEFSFQKPAELVKWVVKVFKSYDKTIDSLSASQLVDGSELGMTEILNEINKVVLYLGDRTKVTSEDIEKICTKSVKSRVFDLTDAIAERNAAKSLKLLNEMLTLKEPIPKILFMVARQFRQILEMKLLSIDGLSLADAASRVGVTPYTAGKILRQAKSFGVEDLKSAIEGSLEADLAIKTGKMDERIALELLISKFCIN